MTLHGFPGPNARLTPFDDGSYTFVGTVGFLILLRKESPAAAVRVLNLCEGMSMATGQTNPYRARRSATPCRWLFLALLLVLCGALTGCASITLDVVQDGRLIGDDEASGVEIVRQGTRLRSTANMPLQPGDDEDRGALVRAPTERVIPRRCQGPDLERASHAACAQTRLDRDDRRRRGP